MSQRKPASSTPKKRRKNPGKGAAFERSICKALSLWVSKGTEEDLFWRSAMSGGRATVSKRKGKLLRAHAGDIVATSAGGHALTDFLYIECKHYADLALKSFVLDRGGKMAAFWTTTCNEAHEHGKVPLLIAKENNTPTQVVMTIGQFRNWNRDDWVPSVRIIAKDYMAVMVPLDALLAARFTQFQPGP